MIEQSTGVPQGPWRRLYTNLRAFFSRFFALAVKPWRFAPLVIDYLLLLQSIWSGRRPGVDVVYPMLRIRKREAGHLARLILDHSSTVLQYDLHVAKAFPDGIDPPCVAVIYLDDVPQDVAANGYSIPADLHGLTCLLLVFETMMTLIVHVFYLTDWGWKSSINWILWGSFILILCLTSALFGDGTLTLTRRSDAPTPGCAVLLDNDFTLILIGNHSVVEAIAETNFSISTPNSVSEQFQIRGNADSRDIYYHILEALCEGGCFCIFVLCWFLFRPSSIVGGIVPLIAAIFTAACLLQFFNADQPRGASWAILGVVCCFFPPMLFVGIYLHTTSTALLALLWHLLAVFLFGLFMVGYTA